LKGEALVPDAPSALQQIARQTNTGLETKVPSPAVSKVNFTKTHLSKTTAAPAAVYSSLSLGSCTFAIQASPSAACFPRWRKVNRTLI